MGSINSAYVIAQLGAKVFKYTIPSPVSSAMLILDGMTLVNAFANSLAWQSINNGTRCAFYIQSTYEAQTTTVLTQWRNVPYITIDSDATDVSVKTF